MRNLMRFGVTGFAIVAGSYLVLHSTDAKPRANINRLPGMVCELQHCGESAESKTNGVPTFSDPDGMTQCQSPPAVDVSLEQVTPANESVAPAQPMVPIELASSSAEARATIFIPVAAEPMPCAPAVDLDPGLLTLLPNTPAIMPYCNDSVTTPALMPYAEDSVWPTTTAETPEPDDWFEEAESIDDGSGPACREDDNLSRQYPGCPATGSDSPAGATGHRSPSKQEKDPFLPVLPDAPGHAVPPQASNQANGLAPSTGSANGRNGQLPELLLKVPTIIRHTAMKPRIGRDGDQPARQPVDTLEIRPGDLRGDDNHRERF